MNNWVKDAQTLQAKAEACCKSGDSAGAAAAYDELSRVWLTGASQSFTADERRIRMDQSIKFRELARKFKAGEGPAQGPGPSGGGGQPSEAKGDEPGKMGKIRAQLSNDDIGKMLIAQVDGFAQTSTVTWDDIGGLDALVADLKKALASAVVRYPAGVRREASGDILMVGPPGTGKTMLAAALASSISVDGMTGRFYNVGLAGLKGHYQGNTEKTISLLYETARENSPSLVFMDEIDSLCTSRSQGGDATSRAILGVMLAEMDGMQKKSSDPRASFVLTVAATNTPWSLDPALLSRFGENRVLVPAPDAPGRRAILEKMIIRQGYKLQEASDLDWLAEDAQTAGYSGRDLRSLTSVAKRRMEMEMNPDLSNWKDLKEVSGREVKLRPLTHDDFLAARTRVPPSITPQVMDDFRRWCDDPNYQPKG